MSRRFVFVPVFGFSDMAGGWLKHPHIDAWGFLDDEKFVPIHSNPAVPALTLMEANTLSDAEIAQAIDIPENSTDLPDEVCVALAKLALLGPGCDHDWGGEASLGAECLKCGTQCELGRAN
jgi:hypothetical protein